MVGAWEPSSPGATRQKEDTIISITQSFERLAQQISAALEPVMKRYIEQAKKINEALREVYILAGAEYGDTEEGYHKWLEELSKNSGRAANVEIAEDDIDYGEG